MFTGIIEARGTVLEVRQEHSNKSFCIESIISPELKIDQSTSHDGVCLTVTEVGRDTHWVTAIDETLKKSTLGLLKAGDVVNLERCLVANGRFDGHVVQGHVDQIGKCISMKDAQGSWLFEFEYDPTLGNVTVEKGSICINGVSLTCFNSRVNSFTVAIIPYTYENTNFKTLKVGSVVNLEFDIIGKYVKRLLNL
jgi:riboflavin synthase